MTKECVKYTEKMVQIAWSSEFTLYVFVNISQMKTPRVTFDLFYYDGKIHPNPIIWGNLNDC